MAKEVKLDEFKGNKIIRIPLSEDSDYDFSFGKKKAQAIVKYFEDIKKFAEEDEGEY